jgi:hypothetical protein
MTLVVGVHSRNTLWLLADRRLSYGGQRPDRDDGVKVMNLETDDGIALLGYAGLGATAQGTQPSEWMSRVLRGRNLPLEQSLGALATVATRELPRHIRQFPTREKDSVNAHFIVAPAFVRSIGWRMYTIDNIIGRGTHWYRFTSHHNDSLPTAPCPYIGFAGTGGLRLFQTVHQWKAELKTVMKAHDRGRVSNHFVADWLAKLNDDASRYLGSKGDRTVSRHSIVVWRPRPDRPRRPGGGHQFYDGVKREPNNPAIPMISRGNDIAAWAGVFFQQLAGRRPGDLSENRFKDIGRLIEALPNTPDDNLK